MSKSKKYYSSKQESLVAEYLDWGVVSGSGSRPNNPGDVEGFNHLCECKTHTKSDQPILFHKDTWSKIVDEASSRFKLPVYVVDDGSQTLSKTWVMFLDAPTSDIVIESYPGKVTGTVSFQSDILLETVQDSKIYKILGWRPIPYLAPIGVFKEILRG